MLTCIRCTTMPVYDESISLLCQACQRKKDGLDPEHNRQEQERLNRHNKIMTKYGRK